MNKRQRKKALKSWFESVKPRYEIRCKFDPPRIMIPTSYIFSKKSDVEKWKKENQDKIYTIVDLK